MSEQTITTEQISVKPCIKCGAQERSKHGNCLPCQRLWKSKNREKINISSKIWRQENAEKSRQYKQKYRETYPDKIKEYSKIYYLREADKIKIKVKKWVDDNSDAVKIGRKNRYFKNKDKAKSDARQWKLQNPDKARSIYERWYEKDYKKIAERAKLNNHKRRSKTKGQKLSKNIVQTLMILQKGKCACCGKSLKQGYHIDHIMPIALGGNNTDDNVQLLTPKCNLSKGAKHPIDFMRSKGVLL